MVISQKSKQTNKCKEKLVILQLIGVIVIKSKETRVIAYTCRYSSGHLIPIIQSCRDELGIKFPLNSHSHELGIKHLLCDSMAALVIRRQTKKMSSDQL